MAKLTSSKVQPNEVVKANDITFGFDSQIDNVASLMKGLLDANNNFVINGVVTPGSSGMTVDIGAILGVNKDTGTMFLNTDKTENVSLSNGGDDTRIDIIEVRGNFLDTTQEQRAFIDFDTKEKTLQNVYTRKELNFEVKVIEGTEGNPIAPSVEEGWVKIAEIVVSAGATSTDASECTIYNISALTIGETNTGWTADSTSVYNIGYISGINGRFLAQHDGSGKHRANTIGANNIILSGANSLTGSGISTGAAISLNGTSYPSTTSIKDMVNTIAAKVTDLFNDYLKNGAFNFNGEIAISDIVESNVLTNAIKIGASGDGSAYCKIGNNTIFTITSNGIIRMSNGYTASNSLDLVTKSITDNLNTLINNLTTRVSQLEAEIDPTVAINTAFSKFNDTKKIRVATTQEIELSGLQTIDGISIQADDIVLVKNQTDKTQNGIYIASSGNWTRGTEQWEEDIYFAKKFLSIQEGTTNGGKVFITKKDTFTVGTDNIEFLETYFSFRNKANTVPIRNENGNLETNAPYHNNDCARLIDLYDATVPIIFMTCESDANKQNKVCNFSNWNGNFHSGCIISVLFPEGSSYKYQNGATDNWGLPDGLNPTSSMTSSSGKATSNTITWDKAPVLSLYYGHLSPLWSAPIKVGGEYAGANFIKPGEVHQFLYYQDERSVAGVPDQYSCFYDITGSIIYELDCGSSGECHISKNRNGKIEQLFQPVLQQTSGSSSVKYQTNYLYVPFNNSTKYSIIFGSWEAYNNPEYSGMFINDISETYFEFRYVYTKNKKADIFATGY